MSIIKYPHPNHLNGTYHDKLARQHYAVIDALHTAIGAVIEATPHGRDWQSDTPANYQTAVAVSRARVLTLEVIREDVIAGLKMLSRA
jgi:hypothetical protein